jgi:hypothetical protein
MILASVESALAAWWLIRAWFGTVSFGLLLLAWVRYRESIGEEP